MRCLALFLCAMFFLISAHAEKDDDWLDEDLNIEVVQSTNGQSISYFEEHFSGYTFSTYSFGDQVKRFVFETRLRFTEKPFDGTTFSAEYRYQHSGFDTPVQDNSNGTRYNKAFSYDLAEFRELFIYQQLNDYIAFQGGRQTIVWGQWSTFSPIDLLLPFDFAVIGPSFNKEQIKQPMESYNIIFTPSDKITSTFYYFPRFTLDYSSKESLDYAVENGDAVVYPSHSEEQQYAFRTVYNGDTYQLGVTLFKGYEVLRNQYSYLTAYDPGVNQLSIQEKYLFPEKYALVFEANKRINERETIGGEVLIQNRKVSVGDLDGLSSYGYLSNDQQTRIEDYINWVNSENSGLMYATQYMIISSLGYEKRINQHLFKLSLSYIHLINPKKTQDGLDLYDEIGWDADSEDWTSSYRFLGSFTYLYFLNDSQTQSVGTMLGFLGSGIGGAVFYGATFKERLTLGIGLEYIKYLSDMSFGASDSGESIVNVDELSIRTGLQYAF